MSARVWPGMAGDEQAPRQSRKDRRRWCRGKPGVEHRPGLPILSTFAIAYGHRCRWYPTGVWKRHADGVRRFEPKRWTFSCSHRIRCSVCGKVLEHVSAPECPDYAPRGES